MDWTSHHMQAIPPSETLKMFEIATRLEQAGKHIYHFEVGQPDFPTPQHVIDAGIDALRNGLTKYVSARGITPLLDAIGNSYKQRGIFLDSRKNIIVTPSAKMALFMGFLSTIDVGDDVLLMTPAWPTYRVMIRNAGGNTIDIPTDASYTFDEEVLKEKISKRTTCLVINSPNNPTGGVLNRDALKTIFDLATDHDFVVFSDEVYESLVYDGIEQTSMLEIDTSLERTLVISGFSKSYSMTGWRLGYAVGNPTTIDNMVRIQQNTTSCATSFVQAAGVAALTGSQTPVENMRREYQRRRDRTIELLREIDGIICNRPSGAFYLFPDFSVFDIESDMLAEMILTNTGVVCTPGKAFGEPYAKHLRFSYATAMQDIEDGISVLKEYLSTLRHG